jgi:hypothetical protein
VPQQGLIYRVLVSSPSDCQQERKIVAEAIHYWNAVNSREISAILEPVLWETHATPEFGDRPQALLNKQIVDSCDVLVGTFWTRLGTNTGEATSGTVEEIDRFRKAGKPVLLYFSLVPVALGSYDEEQYKGLTEYRSQLKREGLIFTYDTLASLREQLIRHLSKTMAQIHSGGTRQPEEKSAEDEGEAALRIFKNNYSAFLRRLTAEWRSERDSNPFSTDEGRFIMDRALREVLTFRSQVVNDPAGTFTGQIDEAIKKLRELQRHQLFIDGGISFREFWNKGDEVVAILERAAGALGGGVSPAPAAPISGTSAQSAKVAVVLQFSANVREEREKPFVLHNFGTVAAQNVTISEIVTEKHRVEFAEVPFLPPGGHAEVRPEVDREGGVGILFISHIEPVLDEVWWSTRWNPALEEGRSKKEIEDLIRTPVRIPLTVRYRDPAGEHHSVKYELIYEYMARSASVRLAE